jgi:hypothetical protein
MYNLWKLYKKINEMKSWEKYLSLSMNEEMSTYCLSMLTVVEDEANTIRKNLVYELLVYTILVVIIYFNWERFV